MFEAFPNEKLFIIDGTGADGCFGLGKRYISWLKLSKIPRGIKSFISSLYQLNSISLSKPGGIERIARILRRSANSSLESSLLAQNSLDGIAYSSDSSGALDNELKAWIDSSGIMDDYQRYVWADLELICEKIFKKKAEDIFLNEGHIAVYPFLNQKMKKFAFFSAHFSKNNPSKFLMKYCLERVLPKAFIYRRKAGFVEAKPTIFYNEIFLSYLKQCLLEGPVSGVLNSDFVIRCLVKLENNQVLSPQVYNFLWASVFSNRWFLSKQFDEK
jgi:hypothetical protein